MILTPPATRCQIAIATHPRLTRLLFPRHRLTILVAAFLLPLELRIPVIIIIPSQVLSVLATTLPFPPLPRSEIQATAATTRVAFLKLRASRSITSRFARILKRMILLRRKFPITECICVNTAILGITIGRWIEDIGKGQPLRLFFFLVIRISMIMLGFWDTSKPSCCLWRQLRNFSFLFAFPFRTPFYIPFYPCPLFFLSGLDLPSLLIFLCSYMYNFLQKLWCHLHQEAAASSVFSSQSSTISSHRSHQSWSFLQICLPSQINDPRICTVQ